MYKLLKQVKPEPSPAAPSADMYNIVQPCYIKSVMSTTYQPKKRKRRRTHGFLKRRLTPGGRNVLARRRRKGRHALTPKKRA